MTQHTPGPWIVCDDDLSDYYLVGPHDGDGIVYQPVVKLHSEANARLIAAAPELLEALEALDDIYRDARNAPEYRAYAPEAFDEAWTQARAAMAKVTGKT